MNQHERFQAMADRGIDTHEDALLADEGYVKAECRDCGTEFGVPAEKADRIGRTKWYSLCGSCIRWEL